jgi:ferredoxin
MDQMQYLKNVVTLKLDNNLCTGCGLCATVCPHEVFEIKNGKAHLIDKNNCMECGACARNCKFGAIKVKSGVGCAAGIINGILNDSEPSCGRSVEGKSNCC